MEEYLFNVLQKSTALIKSLEIKLDKMKKKETYSSKTKKKNAELSNASTSLTEIKRENYLFIGGLLFQFIEQSNNMTEVAKIETCDQKMETLNSFRASATYGYGK